MRADRVRRDAPRGGSRRIHAIVATLLALGALHGCATDADQKPVGKSLSVARPKRDAPGGDAPGVEGPTKAEVDAALQEMSSAIQHGDYQRAIAIGDRLMQKQPPQEVREQVDRMRKAAKQHLLQSFYVDAVVRSEKDRVVIGQPIVGEVTLINIGTEPIVIEDEATSGTTASRTLLHLEVAYREFIPDGTLVSEVLSSNVVIGRRITIAPGRRYSIPLKLDTLEQNPSGTMLRHYDIGGSIFLAELRAGKETIYGQLDLKPHRVRVFPRNYEHLADRPLDRLAEAIRRRSPDHVPLAAALVPEEQRKAALTLLRDALREPSTTGADLATRKACCVALTVITGEDRKPEADAWLDRLSELLS